MIKSISLLTRKDGMTHEQFMKHWVEVHAPLAHGVPGLYADGALFIGRIKTFAVEERVIIGEPTRGANR